MNLALLAAQANKRGGGKSNKNNAAVYQMEMREFQKTLASHKDAAVRLAVIGNPHVSRGVLNDMLEVERDPKCVLALINRKGVSDKAVISWIAAAGANPPWKEGENVEVEKALEKRLMLTIEE
jgi:hypothetical protein